MCYNKRVKLNLLTTFDMYTFFFSTDTTLLNKIIQQATNGKWKEQQNTSSLFSKPLPKCPDSNILDTSLIQEASTLLQPLDHPGTASNLDSDDAIPKTSGQRKM